MMKLRPHHLLCIRKFTGHGYDEAFTNAMTELVQEVRRHPQTEIALVHGCDDLCENCPNRRENACETEEKVRAMDEGVRTYVSREQGTWASFEDASKSLLQGPWTKICGSCQWFSLCDRTERGMIYEDECT